MPLLPASGYPYQPFPSETPSTQVPSAFQTVTANAGSFGAGPAQALERLGGAFEQAGDKLANVAIQRQQLFNQVAADDMSNQVEERINKIMQGDPNVPGDVGFMGKQGRAALDARPAVHQQIEQLIGDTRKNLQNPQQALRFDEATRRLRLNTFNNIGQHYDQQFNKYAADTAVAKVKIAEDNAATFANKGDNAAWESTVGAGLIGIKEAMPNVPPEQVDAAQRAFMKKVTIDRGNAMAIKDPLAAQKFFDANKDHLGDQFDNVMGAVRARATQMQAMEDVVTGGKGSSNLVRGGAVGGVAADTHYNYLTSIGATPNEAALLTSAADAESSLRPDIVHDGGIGYGLYGHNGARLAAMKQAAGTDKPGWQAQAKFALNELRSRPEGAAVNSATTPEQLTDLQMRFEQPNRNINNGNYDGRLASTRDYMNLAATKGPDQLVGRPIPPPEQGQLPDTQVPGLQDTIKQLADNLPKDDPIRFMNAIKLARTQANATYADQQHAQRLIQEQQKKADETISGQLEARMYTGSPNYPTTDEVNKDTRMSAEARRTIVGYIERQTKPDPLAHISAQNQMDLFRRIHEDDTAPDKIRDQKTINDAYIKGDLTWTAKDQLITDFKTVQGASNKIIENRKAELLKMVEPKIVGPALATMDKKYWNQQQPDWAEKELRWKNAVETKLHEYNTTPGKNPIDLFTPGKPDYVGSDDFLKPIIGDLGKQLSDPLADKNAPQKLDLSTKEGLRDAWNKGLITAEQAKEGARKLGLLREDRPVVDVPVAR